MSVKPAILSHVARLYEVALFSGPVKAVRLSAALPRATSGTAADWLPAAARPEAGRMASGRGLTDERARTSCLGEAAELASACFRGNEPVQSLAWCDIVDRAVHPASLVLVSDAQYADRDQWNAKHGGFDWLPTKFDERRRVDWVKATSPDGMDTAMIPAACVYIGYFEPGDDQAFAVADSNGCAAGSTLEEATVAAFLELVERDALAIWWYGRLVRPAFSPAVVEGADRLLTSLKARRRSFHLVDLTTDLGIPVCAAVSAEPGGSAVAIGASAHFNIGTAAVSALTEMLQAELSLGLRMRMPLDDADAFGFWLRNVSFRSMPHLLPSRTTRTQTSSADPMIAAECASLCRNAGLRFLVVNLTRPEIEVPVVRVIVPGLRPLRRRLAKGRLFDVPIQLDWRRRRMSARNANQVPMCV